MQECCVTFPTMHAVVLLGTAIFIGLIVVDWMAFNRQSPASVRYGVVVGPVDRGLVPHGRGRDTGLSRGVWPRRRTVFGRRRLSGRSLERAWSAGVPIWPRGCGRRLSAGRQAADDAVRRIQDGRCRLLKKSICFVLALRSPSTYSTTYASGALRVAALHLELFEQPVGQKFSAGRRRRRAGTRG